MKLLIPVLFLAIGALGWMSRAVAAEGAKVRFVLTIDSELVDKSQAEHASTKKGKRESFVPCANAFVSWRAPRTPSGLKNEALRDWATSISKPVAPRDHMFQIKNGDYFPRAMIIRAGDSIIQTEEASRMYFDGMIANHPFGPVALPGMKYTFPFPERLLIRVVSNPHAYRLGTGSREAYIFVASHTCVSISNEAGIAELTGLPLGVEIPMQVYYPWGRFVPKFKSSTLEFEGKNFTLVFDKQQTVHHIQIVDRPGLEK